MLLCFHYKKLCALFTVLDCIPLLLIIAMGLPLHHERLVGLGVSDSGNHVCKLLLLAS